jgi:hypothetical protein
MKVILGIAGVYLVLLWTLVAAVLIVKSPSLADDWGRLALILIFAAVPTVAAVALLRRTWLSEEGFGAAVLTSLVAAAIVFLLLLGVSLGGD